MLISSKIIAIPFLLFIVAPCFGQDNCYRTFYQKGEKAYQQSDFDAAINNFQAAKVCPDKPANNDIDEKILTAQNGYIDAIRKERKRTQSLALTARSILELQKNDNTTKAFRYAQYALEKDDNSESRAAFYEAAYQLESESKRLVYSHSFKPIGRNNENIKKADFSRGGNFITVFSSERNALVFDLQGNLVDSSRIYFNDFDRNFLSSDEKAIAQIGRESKLEIYDLPLPGKGKKKRFEGKSTGSRVEILAFSPGGNFFAVGFEDGNTHLYRVDGTFVGNLKGLGQRITGLSFSKDDSLLVTGSDRGGVGIWTTGGKLINTVVIPQYYDTKVVISPDNKHLVAASSNRRAQVLTLEGEELIKVERYFTDLSDYNFSSKGEFVSISNYIYDLRKGESYGKLFQTLPEWVYNIQFSPNAVYLLASGNSKNAQIWKRIYKWDEYATLGGHADHIISAVLSPDGKSVLTASYDQTIKIWPLNTNIADTYYDSGKLLRPVIIKDSTYIISHKSKDIHLWNTASGYYGYYGLPVTDIIAQSDDGKMLVTTGDEMVDIWKFDPAGEGIRFAAGISAFHPVRLAQFAKDKKAVAMFLQDDVFYSLTVWELTSLKTRALGGGHGIVSAIEWTPDGKQLLLGNTDGEVLVWNYEIPIDKMTLHKRWVAHDRQTISQIAVSQDGKLIATSSWDNSAKLWNADYEYLLTLRGHNMEINSIDISPDGRFIATASEDRTAKIWDTNGQLIVSLEGYPSDIKRIYFSPDNNYVVTNYGDGTVKSWPFNPKLIKEKMFRFSAIDLEPSEKIKYEVE